MLRFLLVTSAVVWPLLSCGGSKALRGDGDMQSRVNIALLAGATVGGLVENSEMTGLENSCGIDAITGATDKTFNAGVHTEINIKGLRLETGMDYIGYNQSIMYSFPASEDGLRDIRFHQLRLPLTYNFSFFNNTENQPLLVLKAGFSLGYTISKSITEQGDLPDYTFINWDVGPTLGLALYPFSSWTGYRLGLYMDVYRGSRIYEDKYHQAEGMGGQSYLKFGIVVQPGF